MIKASFVRQNIVKLSKYKTNAVRLVDVMPRIVDNKELMLDSAVVQAARVSYGQGSKGIEQDKRLINYLMKNDHTSPFEMVEFKWHLKMPLFCARQWMRHRMASINEISARYTETSDDFFYPDKLRFQSEYSKQCSSGDINDLDNPRIWKVWYESIKANEEQYDRYKVLCNMGVAREQTRMILPQNMMTEFYWKIDLHNMLKFLKLRTHHHSQQETQNVAFDILKITEKLCPTTISAWKKKP